MPPLRAAIATICVSTILVPAVASADASVASRAAARDAEGRHLMAGRDFAAACSKFEESLSLAPSVGAAIDLGACYEKEGKLASAWSAYKSAAAAAVAAHQKARAIAARKLMARVESHAPRITINVADGARVAGLEVRSDDEVVDATDWGNAIPRDGGGHDIQASAPGKKAWRHHVDLDNSGQSVAVDVPALEDEGPAKGRAATVATQAKDGGSQDPAAAPEAASAGNSAHPGQTQRLVGFIVGGVGIAGLGTGIIAGIEANSANGDLKSACGTGPTCDPSHAALHDEAVGWATISDIAFIAGGVAVAAGAVIYLTAPRDSGAVSVGIAPASRGAGLSLLGRF